MAWDPTRDRRPVDDWDPYAESYADWRQRTADEPDQVQA